MKNMKSRKLKIPFILCVLSAMFISTMTLAQPAIADDGGVQTAKIDPALRSAMKANPRGDFPVIVQTTMPNLKGKTNSLRLPNLADIGDERKSLREVNSQRAKWLGDRITQVGGIIRNHLPIVGGSSARLSVTAIGRLSREPFVSFIQLDKKMKPMGSPGELSNYTQVIHAAEVWAQGINGQGISVAVLDSGVAAADDLSLPVSRIVASIDFTGQTASGDPGGHGTHVAGIIAGNGADSAQARMGVAPAAKIVNVRVIQSDGTADLSSILAGIQWVVQNKKTYNIRVMNLSFGADSTIPYRDDVLSSAVEMAWANGIVVVAAAGNGGPNAGTVVTPGSDPFIITVGALDDNGTLVTTDDNLAAFSSRGPTVDGLHKPDVVAPGRKIVSLRVPKSFLDVLLPERITNNNYFRLSGTSMSSPVVAGTAALMLQKNPNLKPNQVKALLMQTAHPVTEPPPRIAGAEATLPIGKWCP
jgi:serine protease AprX